MADWAPVPPPSDGWSGVSPTGGDWGAVSGGNEDLLLLEDPDPSHLLLEVGVGSGRIILEATASPWTPIPS